MDKKTLTLIGLAGLGLAALYIWSKKKQKSFANLVAPLPYATVTAGPNVGQVVFFGRRGSPLYFPAGTEFYQNPLTNQWMWQDGSGDWYPLTGTGALTQQQIWNLQ